MSSMSRTFSFVFVLILISSCQNTTLISKVETISGHYGNTDWIKGSDSTSFSKLEDVIAQADYEFYLDQDDRLDPVNGSHKTPISLPRTIEDVVEGRRAFPGFVVVQLHKLAQIDEVDARVMRVNQCFFAKGADRVLVTGFRGFGRQIYSDRIKKPSKTSHSNRHLPPCQQHHP